jgi:TonB family protein
LRHAIGVSVAVHAAVIGVVLFSHARLDNRGLAKAPTSSMQARILTYQNGITPSTTAAEEGGAAASGAAVEGAQTLLVPQVVDLAKRSPVVAVVIAESKSTVATSETVRDSASLDSSPELLSSVTLEYPMNANNREGLVTLAITVAGDGRVDDVRVVKAIPSGFFEAAAIAGFQNARFTPGMLGGVGVKSRMVIEVEFMPTNRGGLGIK